jgi:hypothetical protein
MQPERLFFLAFLDVDGNANANGQAIEFPIFIGLSEFPRPNVFTGYSDFVALSFQFGCDHNESALLGVVPNCLKHFLDVH